MATVELLDDDDGFDWEAAVREIDVACEEATKLSKNPARVVGQTRQSTLDKFIGVSVNRQSENQNGAKAGNFGRVGVVECSETVSGSVEIDPEAAKTWIYPVNIPRREYQLSITRTALFSNTLVALPTGLGKTLIAAVVMYNYFRWFPKGKIVFTAPSRPLVMQQIEACHNIVGIPQEWTIDMTGQTSPSRRASFWKTKRVFFVTPQVLEKDIQSGSCLVKQMVCLVVDEAHRACGNYSYCVAVRELMAVPVQLRILALTATPGSKQQAVQQIINNLQISTLEYRNEIDKDVAPYVHERDHELIEVAMGQEAVEVNDLLLEVIRPFVARLSALGVIPKRDIQTLSPYDFVSSRDKFRQAPPEDLPQSNYEEVDGHLGVLITLAHIRKLLSSHGIRPAFEMLEEKLKQWNFRRFVSRNEALQKAKMKMEQGLSHGALSPKFSKMLEVLVEHFKNNDPQNSRVIIFSNFRGSVRDIMNSLANIGDYVKATEFIGQSSGKTLKGQSQKVQQAVLKKFRAGGYNVIVATSIGEEGLDIVEVDLVICFDANISPLRMIQRMGRTGRKHKGRVVVLACEGSELKGYQRKQASSKAIKKHMRNGGINSFDFHSSPRMVPHAFRPEVLFFKFSIEQFVHRGKKVKDDDESLQTPTIRTKLTDSENELVAKYFDSSRENNWRPSLISFPHFQAYPSCVHEVVHSVRTTMLIDAMQYLQELSIPGDAQSTFIEDERAPEQFLGVEFGEQPGDCMKGLRTSQMEDGLIGKEVDPNATFSKDPMSKENHDVPDLRAQTPPTHSFLFGTDYVCVDSQGRVLVVSVPELPLSKHPNSCCSSPDSTLYPNVLQDSLHLEASPNEFDGKNDTLSKSGEPRGLQEKSVVAEKNFQTQTSEIKSSSAEDISKEIPCVLVSERQLELVDESIARHDDADLSPRLTNLLKSGVVPESPINDHMQLRSAGRDKSAVKGHDTFLELRNDCVNESSVQGKNVNAVEETTSSPIFASWICNKDELKSPVVGFGINSPRRCKSSSHAVHSLQTPLLNLSNSSSRKDWELSSGGKSGNAEQTRRLKRLRKYRDVSRRKSDDAIKENANHSSHVKEKRKKAKDACAYIEEEAEVSSEVTVSDDEEDEQESDSYEDSFIDDRTGTVLASTQTGVTRSDMMAIYRRSLLSQSPVLDNVIIDSTSHSSIPKNLMHESGSSSGTRNPSEYSYTIGAFDSNHMNSISLDVKSCKIPSAAMPKTNGPSQENDKTVESRKRKRTFSPIGSLPIHNLEQEFLLSSNAEKDSCMKLEEGNNIFEDVDDQFYDDIDLDALEEQAANLLRHKSEVLKKNENRGPEPVPRNFDVLDSPSFDLGI